MVVCQAITAKDSRQKPQGFAAKAIVACSSSDHRKRLTTEAARIRSKSNRWLFVRRSPQKTHDRSRKDSQQKQSLVVCQAITAKDSRQKPQGFAAKAIVNCSSGDHRKRLTTEAARIRSKSNRQSFVTRSPQKTHDRSRKDSQQKRSLVVCQAITAKDSRQKPQGFAAKAIVNRSSRDHRKRLTTEAARIRSKCNRQLFVTRSPQKTHDRSRKDSQQKQSSIVRHAITAKAARIRSKSNCQLFVRRSPQKPQGFAANAIVNCSSRDHRKRLTTEAARIRSKSNHWLFVKRSLQKTHDRSCKDSQQKQSLVVCQAITAKDSRQKPQGFAAKGIVNCSSGDHRKRLTTEAARIRSKSNRQLFVRRSPQKTHDRGRKDSQQKQLSILRHAITAKDSRQKPQGFAAKAIVNCSSRDHRKSRRGFAVKAIVNCSSGDHRKSRKDSQQMQSSIVRHAITAKDSRQKPQGFAAKAIIGCSLRDHCKRLTTEAARIRSKNNHFLFVRRSPQKAHDRSRKDLQPKELSIVRQAITAKDSRQKPQGFAAKAIVNCSSGDHRKRLTTEAARIRSKSNCQFFVTRSPQKTHDRSRKDSRQKQSSIVRHAITAKAAGDSQ